jgi:hypothetical protein
VENRPLNFSDPTGHQPAACSYEGECGIPIGLIDFDGVKSNGEIRVDLFNFFVTDPVMSIVELGEASFSGQMREDFQTEPLQASARYGLPTLGLVASLMGFGGVAGAADEGLGLVDDAVRAFDDDAARLADDMLPSYPCGIGHSFSADTLVATSDGLKPISELEIGDEVLAYDESTREIDYYSIQATWMHIDPIIVYLTIDGEVIETTPTHPFYTEESWREAGDLELGTRVRSATGRYGTVQGIQFVLQPQPMYDLTVAEVHTFFVSEDQWLVHNCGGNNLLRPGPYAPDASEAIPATGTRPTTSQQVQINALGEQYGCHTCGASTPGTSTGNWIGDHQPVQALNTNGEPMVYYSHCVQCMRQQGGVVSSIVRVRKEITVGQIGH